MTIADLPLPEAGVQSGGCRTGSLISGPNENDEDRMYYIRRCRRIPPFGNDGGFGAGRPRSVRRGGDFAPDSLYQAPSMLFYPAFSAPRLPSLLQPDLPVSREDRAMAGISPYTLR